MDKRNFIDNVKEVVIQKFRILCNCGNFVDIYLIDIMRNMKKMRVLYR